MFCPQCGAQRELVNPDLKDANPTTPAFLAPLLRSNDTPLESEVPVICATIAEGQHRVDVLDAQIEILQAGLAQLTRHREECAKYVRDHRAIISPVRRLPTELLCTILSLAFSGSRLGDQDMRAGWRTRVPWYLVHVCQFWRRCALSYPSLWSFITIPPSYPHSSRHFPSLEAQLTHSADAALDLYFPSVDMGTETRVLDLILRNCTRWRSLHLRDASDSGWPSPVVLRKLKWLLPVAGRLNQLEKLSASESLIIPNFFSVAPNLHKIHGRFHSSVALPWAQITHYRQSSFPDVHARILTAAPNLQECALIFTYDHILPDAMPDAMITLPHLRRFSSLDMSAFPSKFLDHLTAPLLQDLIICDGSLAVIPPFVHRSSCTLKRLALARCADLGPEIIDILRGLPSLESLVLEKSQDDNDEQKHVDVFNALTVSGNASDICPNLTSLVFGWNRSTKFIPRADNTFFNMVRSRFNRTLRHSFRLRVLAEYYNSNRISREITALQKEGFDAEFLKHGDPEMITDL